MIPLLCLLLLGQEAGKELEKEKALGEALAAGIRAESDLRGLEEVDQYVRRIAGKLDGSVRVELVRAGERVEPIVLPGRLVLVPVKALAAVEDEAELVGMLAHAVGHVVLDHGVGERKAEGPTVFQCPWMGCHGDTGKPGNPAAVRGMLKKLQEWELEADGYGVALAIKAGWDGSGWRRYVARVQSGAVLSGSVLPVKAVRLERMAASAVDGIVTTEEFARMRAVAVRYR